MGLLYHIQQTLIAYLKALSYIKNKVTIVGQTVFSEEDLMTTKISSLHPFQLWVSYPFPLQTAKLLSEPCWDQLSLSCTLVQKNLPKKQEPFLDLAEQISFSISHKKFSTERWEGSFVLTEKQPWEWLNMKQKTALKINFQSQNFNVFFT